MSRPLHYLRAQEVIPSGFTLTTPDEINLTVSAGSSATVAFGNQKAGAISGMVYSDFNGDGLIDGFDTGMSGGTVYIDSNNNGKLDAGEKSVKSLNAGQFNFFNLVPGTCTVREIPPTRYRLTTQGVRSVVVTSGAAPAIAFGNQMLAIITGTVYNDINANSGLDTGEHPSAERQAVPRYESEWNTRCWRSFDNFRRRWNVFVYQSDSRDLPRG